MVSGDPVSSPKRMTRAMRFLNYFSRRSFAAAIVGLGALLLTLSARAASSAPYGLAVRPSSKAYLHMPPDADGPIPRQLSETGAYKDLRKLMRFVTQNGFEHHVAMVRGHHADVVAEAVTRYLNWPMYHHGVEAEVRL